MESAIEGYSFSLNGEKYEFKTHLLEFSDIIGSGLNNKVLFIAPGGNVYWKDQLANISDAKKFRENIKDFVSKGGGYIGTCGGACIVTLGKKEPAERKKGYSPKKRVPDWYKLDCYLKMVNVWSNGFWFEEQQYDRKPHKTHIGGIPLDSFILDTEDAKNILGMKNEIVNIRYWGGSAYWDAKEHITPLAKYEQEPMDVYPLHWFNGNKVHTDVKANDGFSIISATYGKGRLVLFSQHPEVRSFHHGTPQDIVENFLKTKYRFDKELDSNTDRNLDLIRNAAKWCTKPGLPSAQKHKKQPTPPEPSNNVEPVKNKSIFALINELLKKIFRV